MWTRACALAELALALALAAGLARADEPLRLKLATTLSLPRRAAYEALIADVNVNGQKRGEFTVHRDESGGWYVRLADLAALGLADRAVAPRTVLVEGEALVPLAPLGAESVAFDEARLALDVRFPAPALRKSTYDLALGRPNPAREPERPGAFVNYRLAASDGNGAEPLKLGLANELALRVNGILVRNEAAIVRSEGSTRGLRYATQIIYDVPAEQQRWMLGDHAAASGELGSTLPVGGLSLAKLYQLTPHFVRQPLAGYAGAVSTPSQVEVRMGGIPVFREQVPAGPFELKNLQQFAGARDVEIVVRDALGRQQVIGFPYYFAEQALRQGLHEYNYSIGALREDPGAGGSGYGAGLVSGVHRYGLSDRLTIGFRGEAAGGVRNLGPTALYRDDRLGAFSAGFSASRRDGRAGNAVSLGHVYQAGMFGLRSNWRRYSESYAIAQDLVAPPALVRSEYGVGGSLTLGAPGALFIDRSVTRRYAGSPAGHDSAATRLTYTWSYGRQGSLFATVARVHEAQPDTQIFVGMLVSFDRVRTAHLGARRSAGETVLGAQFSSAVPQGEGLGYRFGYDGIGAQARESSGFAQYNARAASLSLEGVSTRGATEAERYEAAIAGAVTWTGGRFDLTRHVDDSFVAVQLAAPLQGVRVYSNNQEVGRTDRRGRLVVPGVPSYNETQISIEEADVPLDHSLGAMRKVVSPAYRSGSLLEIDVRRVRAAEGVLLERSRGDVRPAENAVIRIGEREIATGRDGRYYVEDLPPGRHEARLGECRFFIDMPQSDEPVATLPEVTACE
jgi:outer membrane usher protein